MSQNRSRLDPTPVDSGKGSEDGLGTYSKSDLAGPRHQGSSKAQKSWAFCAKIASECPCGGKTPANCFQKNVVLRNRSRYPRIQEPVLIRLSTDFALTRTE